METPDSVVRRYGGTGTLRGQEGEPPDGDGLTGSGVAEVGLGLVLVERSSSCTSERMPAATAVRMRGGDAPYHTSLGFQTRDHRRGLVLGFADLAVRQGEVSSAAALAAGHLHCTPRLSSRAMNHMDGLLCHGFVRLRSLDG
jgi:hypothetical protein